MTESKNIVRIIPSLLLKDKRLVNLFLTSKGKDLRKKAREYVIQFNEAIYENINEKDIKTCFDVLKKINFLIDQNNIFKN